MGALDEPESMSTEVTTIDCVPNNALKEIMLRLPTSAILVHAALASKRWHHIIADRQFLKEYRKRHPFSPFLGIYVPMESGGLPSFFMADSIRSVSNGVRNLDLIRAATMAFSLDELEGDTKWRLLDCHNSQLLLARGDEAIEVYSPLARKRTPLCLPEDSSSPSNFSMCLLQGHGDDAASFRVISVQHRRHSRSRIQEVRAIEYNSRTKIWMYHPWKTVNNVIVYKQDKLMHAGQFIFCRGSSLLVLDTSNMEFSSLPLPPCNKEYTIGEMEDGMCYLVSADAVGMWNETQLRMWKLENLEWKLEEAVGVRKVLGNRNHPQYIVRAVTNGLALLCSFKHHVHFIIDLKTFRVKDKFEFKDLVAYPLQMPWPPTFSMDISSGEQSITSTVGIHQDVSANLGFEAAHLVDGVQNHACAAKNIGCSDDKSPDGSEVSRSIADFQYCMKIQKMNLTSQLDTRIVKEPDALLILDQELAGHNHFNGILDESVYDQTETSPAPYKTICSEIQQRDTLTRAAVEAINYDGPYAECHLNSEDTIVTCNGDTVLLDCSDVNETLSNGSHDNGPELREEAPQQNCMPSSTPEGLSIEEAAKSHQPFGVINGLPHKYNTSNPEKFGYTRIAIKQAATATQSAMVCNKKRNELGAGNDQSLSVFELSAAENGREGDELKEIPCRKQAPSISIPNMVRTLRRSKRKVVTGVCCNAQCGMDRCTTCFASDSTRRKCKA